MQLAELVPGLLHVQLLRARVGLGLELSCPTYALDAPAAVVSRLGPAERRGVFVVDLYGVSDALLELTERTLSDSSWASNSALLTGSSGSAG